MANQNHSSPLRSCFRGTPPRTTSKNRSSAAVACNNPDLATCLYQTGSGLFGLTWSRNLFGRSFYLHLLPRNSTLQDDFDFDFSSLSSPSFTLHIKPLFFFCCKYGSRNLDIPKNYSIKSACVFWDLSKAKFGSGPDPQSGFYIAVVIDGEMALLVGDSEKEAYAKTRVNNPSDLSQSMVVRREHVYGNKLYRTKAKIGGKQRDVCIDCRVGEDPRLYISVDDKRVLKIKHLKWKFRGNERIKVEDDLNVQVSWDVYNWLFEEDEEGYAAVFVLRFEDESDLCKKANNLWCQQSFGFGFETKKMKKGLLRSAKSSSSSSSSLSSASSSCSSVMEWASMEEDELKGPFGFSLMVYAWKA